MKEINPFYIGAMYMAVFMAVVMGLFHLFTRRTIMNCKKCPTYQEDLTKCQGECPYDQNKQEEK